jgi:hypothetical protein
MSGIGREKIYEAFYRYLKAQLEAPTGSFGYSSRRYRPPGQVGSSQYPCFYAVGIGEEYDRTELYVPAKITLFTHVTIQTDNGADPDAITETEINNLADEVESAVTNAAEDTAQVILGGLVQEAWINGRQAHIPASSSGRFSEQVLAVELILPTIR